jgi:hypothetical protein
MMNLSQFHALLWNRLFAVILKASAVPDRVLSTTSKLLPAASKNVRKKLGSEMRQPERCSFVWLDVLAAAA